MKNICCKSLRYLRPYFLNIYTKTIKFIIGTNIYIIGNSKNRNKRNIIRPKATEYKKHIPKNIMFQVLLLITIPRNDINNNMIAAIKVSMDLNDKSQILCTAQKNGIVNFNIFPFSIIYFSLLCILMDCSFLQPDMPYLANKDLLLH